MLNVENSITSQVAPKIIKMPNFKSNPQAYTGKVNFKAENDSFSVQSMYDNNDTQKEYKKQKRKNNILTGISAAAMIAIIITCIPALKSMMGKGGKEMQELGLLTEKDFKEMIVDLKKDGKDFKDLHLPNELNEKLTQIKDKITRNDVYNKLNLPESVKAILLYGPAGTGKTTFSYSLAKFFKNARLYDVNMTKVCTPYIGLPEKNLQNLTSYITKEADALLAKGSDERVVVLFDELDRVLLNDLSNGAKHSNDLISEYKKCFNELFKRKNITIIGTSNKEIAHEGLNVPITECLNKDMIDRFGQKIRVPRPTAEAIEQSIIDRFKDVENAKEFLNHPKFKDYCKLLVGENEAHQFSFRQLDNIYETIVPSKENKVTMKEMVDAAINLKDTIFLNESDIEALTNLTSSGRFPKPKNINPIKAPNVTPADTTIIPDNNGTSCAKGKVFDWFRNLFSGKLFHRNKS